MTSASAVEARRAADPNTPQAELAWLADSFPELRPAIAENPSAYPALLGWLAEFGDPAVHAALARRAARVTDAGAPAAPAAPTSAPTSTPTGSYAAPIQPGLQSLPPHTVAPVVAPIAASAPTGSAPAAAQQPAAPRNPAPGLGWKHLYWAAPLALVLVVGMVAATAVFTRLATSSMAAGPSSATAQLAAPANMTDGGFTVSSDALVGADTVDIVVYVDYLCPYCQLFDGTNLEQIEDWVDSGEATLTVHPIAILTNQSNGTRYAERAANAAVCVASYAPDRFLDMHDELFDEQPREGTDGLGDAELIALAADAGAGDDAVANCIAHEEYTEWVRGATDGALSGPLPGTDLESVTGTPTVLVDGEQYPGALDDEAEFAAFVQQVAAG